MLGKVLAWIHSTGHNTGAFNCCRSWLGPLYFLNAVETSILAKQSAQAPSNLEAVAWAKNGCKALKSAPASSPASPLTQRAIGDVDSDRAL